MSSYLVWGSKADRVTTWRFRFPMRISQLGHGISSQPKRFCSTWVTCDLVGVPIIITSFDLECEYISTDAGCCWSVRFKISFFDPRIRPTFNAVCSGTHRICRVILCLILLKSYCVEILFWSMKILALCASDHALLVEVTAHRRDYDVRWWMGFIFVACSFPTWWVSKILGQFLRYPSL